MFKVEWKDMYIDGELTQYEISNIGQIRTKETQRYVKRRYRKRTNVALASVRHPSKCRHIDAVVAKLTIDHFYDKPRIDGPVGNVFYIDDDRTNLSILNLAPQFIPTEPAVSEGIKEEWTGLCYSGLITPFIISTHGNIRKMNNMQESIETFVHAIDHFHPSSRYHLLAKIGEQHIIEVSRAMVCSFTDGLFYAGQVKYHDGNPLNVSLHNLKL